MGSSKPLWKGKWFLCFKPEEGSLKSKKNILRTLSNDSLKSSSFTEGCQTAKEKPGRSFSRVLRAVLLEKYLSKKIGSKKRGKDVSRASSDLSSRFDKAFNSFYDKKASSCKESSDVGNSVSSRSSSLLSSSTILASSSQSSSCSSSITSNSRTASERKQSCLIDFKELKSNKPVSAKKKISGNSNSIVGLYFLLICLMGVIFCGKAFAIFCTSTCLFLLPCRFRGVAVEPNEVDLLDIDSDEYKKKVIMEGLLQRNHTRRQNH